MTTKEIRSGNEVIARWMGDRDKILCDPKWMPGDELVYLRYHLSWDWIIPVCLKWDSIPFSMWNKEQLKKYNSFTARIEQAVLLYDSPKDVADILAEAIEWYNNQKSNS